MSAAAQKNSLVVVDGSEYTNNFASNQSATGGSQIVFALIDSNGSNETKLCIAAATSNEEFSKVRGELFGEETVDDVSCNDMHITSFARKYGNVEIQI